MDAEKKKESDRRSAAKRLESKRQVRIWLTFDEAEQAKAAAADRGMTLTEYVKRLLEQGLIE